MSMNDYQLIIELRNCLQATVSVDELQGDVMVRVVKPMISDETERATLTTKLVTLLNSIQPIAQ